MYGMLRMARAPGVVLPLLVLSCGGPAPSVLGISLVSGQSVSQLVGVRDSTVILLYNPADCFSCSSVLGRWIEAKRQHPDQVLLVFTRPPTPNETRELAAYRIAPDGIVRDQKLAADFHTPSEFLAVRGKVVKADTLLGVGVVSPLLTLMEQPAKSPATATR